MARLASCAFILFITAFSLFSSSLIPPSDPNIIYEGRADFNNSDYIEYNWSGFTIIFTVDTETSTDVVLHFDDVSNCFNVQVNGEQFPILKTVSGIEAS